MATTEKNKLITALGFAGALIFLPFMVYMAERVGNFDFSFLGLAPRSLNGLPGILIYPFLHADINHLLSNLPPLFILGGGLFYLYPKVASTALLGIYLLSGGWLWLFAEGGVHIGASGIVYGLAAFHFFSGVFRKNSSSLALSLLVAFLYGGMIWGVFPAQPGISWEGHLFGALAGIFFAWLLRNRNLPPQKKYSWEEEKEEPRQGYDVWQYTPHYIFPEEESDSH